ncbi:LysE family transporter [Peribacillus kribbensis]|uniref:LysE family transporter n=1 Tax=Peribacillus kribbensis TaxID=356658 RepID=UPI000405820E|nr:LysE family transporter [Peribacillus kribbensis]
MSIFFSYIFLGLSLAAPIGPINAAQIDKGIKSGFWNAWLVGLGATVADMVYMLLVYFGLVQFIEIPFMKTLLWSFGCFVLIYTGIESMASAGKFSVKNTRSAESHLKSFTSGFFMSLSNPLTILFWIGIYGSILAKTAASYEKKELVLYSSAIFIGVLIWDITMAAIASSFRRFLRNGSLAVISVLSGLSLIGFGLYFGYQACTELFF